MKILIIKIGALGDVLRTTFIASGLKEKYARATIWWLTKEAAKGLLENNHAVDRIIVWGDRAVLLEEEFDWLISLDDEEEVCAFASKIKTKKMQGAYRDSTGKQQYTSDVEAWFGMGILRSEDRGGKQKADELKKQNRRTFQEIYASMFHLLATVDKKPILNLTNEEKKDGKRILESYGINKKKTIIGINSGAGSRWLLKLLSIEKTTAVCQALAKNKENTILLVGGIDEKERNEKIKEHCPEKNIFFIEPTADVRVFASIINCCDLLITADSLALHIALALGKQTIVFFGPTSPWEIEMFGLGEKIFKESDCLCCYQQTTEKKPNCIDLVTPQDILKAVEKRRE